MRSARESANGVFIAAPNRVAEKARCNSGAAVRQRPQRQSDCQSEPRTGRDLDGRSATWPDRRPSHAWPFLREPKD